MYENNERRRTMGQTPKKTQRRRKRHEQRAIRVKIKSEKRMTETLDSGARRSHVDAIVDNAKLETVSRLSTRKPNSFRLTSYYFK